MRMILVYRDGELRPAEGPAAIGLAMALGALPLVGELYAKMTPAEHLLAWTIAKNAETVYNGLEDATMIALNPAVD